MGKEQEAAWRRFKAAQGRRNYAADRLARLVSAGHRGGPSLNEAVRDYDVALAEATESHWAWTDATIAERLELIAANGGVGAWWAARELEDAPAPEFFDWEDHADEVPLIQEVPC